MTEVSMRSTRWFVLVAALLATGLFPVRGAEPPAGLVVEDIFGRPLNRHGLILVDWEGYLANPAIKFYVRAPAGAALPARVVLTATERRLHFDLPSTTGPKGPRKDITLDGPEKVPVYISIFPDRDGKDEDHVLKIEYTDAKNRREQACLPIHVIDQDRDRPSAFQITVDFSQDRTGFFQDEKKRAVIIQAANDWAYFLDDMHLDEVPAGKETTLIWSRQGFKDSRTTTNSRAYTGYLMYVYGIQSDLLRSGGEPSRLGGLQAQRGKLLPIRRSGGVEIEVQGNYNKRGWLVQLDDGDWWKATNQNEVPNDLYSIAHHEMGHALFFNPANLYFAAARRNGKLQDAALRDYLGADPRIDSSDHFDGTVDPASLHGAFGYEYDGRMPLGRWLITKQDLLAAQALGYKLRDTSAFAPLALTKDKLPAGSVAAPYSAKLRATGGIPFYQWEVSKGALPEGLALNSFTGEIKGTPRERGSFTFSVRVRDYDEKSSGKSQEFQIQIQGN
jgi:hypothetical protein